MKKIGLFLVLMMLFSQALVSQISESCNGGTFQVTAVVGSNNVLTVSVTNTKANTCSALFQLTSTYGVIVTGQAGIGNVTDLFFYDGASTISLPSPGCQPFVFNLRYSGDACVNCPSPQLTLAPAAPIPTMGEWSMIILLISLSIIGVRSYKSARVRSQNVVN